MQWSQMIIKYLGQTQYAATFDAMRNYTANRNPSSADQLWLLQHDPVFTLGVRNRQASQTHIRGIPVVITDRGGLTTYHAPGQITGYVLIDLKRAKITIRDLVNAIENSLKQLLSVYNIQVQPRADAPGLYHVKSGKKIASIGLKIKKACSYHGFTLNVNMDMTPWQWINPCGLGIAMTQIVDCYQQPIHLPTVIEQCGQHFLREFHLVANV